VAIDVRTARTVLAPPSGAEVARDLVYRVDGERTLHLDAYRPAGGRAPRPAVFLVSGDAPEEVISHSKDWGVFSSYGEHLAANGLVGVAFDHRSAERFTRIADVAADVAAAIAFVRSRGDALGVDPDRVAVWVFSAGGPFGLAPLLRERPVWLRCVAGFYTVWDLRPFLRDGGRGPLEEEALRLWSPVVALDDPTGLPPILIARAGRDAEPFVVGTDRFAARARAVGADVTVLDHPTGQHGFDTRDDVERSREIIRDTLAFFVRHLRPRP
jgi:acetyl esterase/lipase